MTALLVTPCIPGTALAQREAHSGGNHNGNGNAPPPGNNNAPPPGHNNAPPPGNNNAPPPNNRPVVNINEHREGVPPPPGVNGINEHREGVPPPPGVPERRDERFAPPPRWAPPERGPSGPVPGLLAPPPPGRRESIAELRAREEREHRLRIEDEERERSREDRIRREHEDFELRYRSFHMTFALTEEFNRYSERRATIERLRALAVAQGRFDSQRRADEILAHEEARHNAWLLSHPRG